METGFRERQGISPFRNRDMRFEPRPGYFQARPVARNPGRSPAISNDPRTWPDFWPDRLDDPTTPAGRGSWNGYFGKQIVADQESYMVLDDQYYDAWNFYPDSRDSTRGPGPAHRGARLPVGQSPGPQRDLLALRHHQRGHDRLRRQHRLRPVHGLRRRRLGALLRQHLRVRRRQRLLRPREFNGRSSTSSTPGTAYGHGVDLQFLFAHRLPRVRLHGDARQPDDGIDNDLDGITDERRDSGPGQQIVGQEAIRSYVQGNYDLARFETHYGPVEERPAYAPGVWWTGDEDMDWVAETPRRGRRRPTGHGGHRRRRRHPHRGRAELRRTDLDESDQIGLTGFKINRIRPGQGNPNQTVDDILFFTDGAGVAAASVRAVHGRSRSRGALRHPAGLELQHRFLFASGPFTLRRRADRALQPGAGVRRRPEELRATRTVQQIYNANYRFAVPPPMPTVTAEEGDGYVRLSWDDVAERGADPVTGEFDFEGYRIYRSTDPEFRDPKVITTGTGSGPIGNGRPHRPVRSRQRPSRFHRADRRRRGLLPRHRLRPHAHLDRLLRDQRSDLLLRGVRLRPWIRPVRLLPLENAITVSRTPRGARSSRRTSSRCGPIRAEVVNSNLVPEGHVFKIDFAAAAPESLAATTYALLDSTTGEVLFESGRDLRGAGVGPVGAGLLPIVDTPHQVSVDTENTGLDAGSPTDANIVVEYTGTLPLNLRRPGFPDDITVTFSDVVLDTSLAGPGGFVAVPSKFRVIAHGTDRDRQLDFRFRDRDGDGTLSRSDELIDIFTYAPDAPTTPRTTWRLQLAANTPDPSRPPSAGDVFRLRLIRPFDTNDAFVFNTLAARIDPNSPDARAEFQPYVVPNPYVGSASFEPERFAVSGRGERRVEFRGLPARCTVRIYNVRGELVQTLDHDSPSDGYVAWDLRTRDNLDLAPGLYVFHVDGGSLGTAVGKFAIVK
jgi:hypothetical protein